MPQGKGTYGSKRGRPPKKTGMAYKRTLTKKSGKKGISKVKPMKKMSKITNPKAFLRSGRFR